MDRRVYLKQIALLTGAAVVGADFFLSGCSPNGTTGGLTKTQLALLDEIGETILPATNTPGAKAAEVGKFMNVMVRDCYTTDQQTAFKTGMESLEQACQQVHGKNFTKSNPTQRHELLVRLEKEAKAYNETKAKEKPVHYYTMMKQLTLWGFFTSKTGMTETLRYVPIPGRYDGALPYTKGDKAWAE
ncbi:MAG: gluconate 2-dehydrogenase subunit 3 family protein [Bacteroidetes bacterium]|nr:gluconate 2-dehydrogenase subunit 3 family protein [Bacteroidota bacterium]